MQGVGFRPFVFRLAQQHALAGTVRNTAGEVRIEVEGLPEEVERFLAELTAWAPPLARIERIEVTVMEPAGRSGFSIIESEDQPDRRQSVPADVAMCEACRAELHDPADRRYGYAFITCTDCGPRYTIIEAVPYDRERTTMRAFAQCPACLAEYRTPTSRRYHAETNACPACGPSLTFLSAPAGTPMARHDDALHRAADLLRQGGILALRGMGGFHLAVDAGDEAAVFRLRERKRREAKPFAVMIRDVDQARLLALVDEVEARLLESPERPVVLVARRDSGRVASAVAPGLDTLGLMLPSTPLHDLLLVLVDRPLVMTSGNLSDEPIAMGTEEAVRRLGSVADGFLVHDREILSRCDDSVLRSTPTGPLFLRRARGFAPLPIELPASSPVPLVAVGAELKNTFTLVHGSTAWVSPHLGDLDSLEALEHFRATLARYRALFRVEPAVAVRDLHPGYRSTAEAEALGCDQLIAVQHHHAHIAAVLAEHGRTGPVVGLAFDGTGYGDDGHIWGAEVLVADLAGYRRVGHLRYAPLPGGDLAARRPWRAALGYLASRPEAAGAFALAFRGIDETELAVAQRQIARRINAPLASSMGRLFDAAAAVLGVRWVSHYEGQAAMELEALAGRGCAREFPLHIEQTADGCWEIDPLPLLVALGERRLAGRHDVRELAADFHASIARAAVDVACRACEAAGIGTVALGGGVFQNARLLWSIHRRLEDRNIEVLLPRRLGPNDGAVSFGQAAVGAVLAERRSTCV